MSTIDDIRARWARIERLDDTDARDAARWRAIAPLVEAYERAAHALRSPPTPEPDEAMEQYEAYDRAAIALAEAARKAKGGG